MSAPLTPGGNDCCHKCPDPVVVNVPGPQGPAGANGTNGTNGINTFSITTQSFTIPAIGSDVGVNVDQAAWVFPGALVSCDQSFFIVDNVSGNHLVLQNPASYSDVNAAPGTGIPISSKIITAGLRGIQGPAGAASLNPISPTTTKGDLIVDNGVNNPTASDIRFGTGGAGTNGKVLHADSSQASGLRYGSIDLSGSNSSLSGALGIANGGTGQTTKAAAFNALSPLTTTGDLITYSGGSNIRLAIGTTGQVLTVVAGAPAWMSPGGELQIQTATVATYSNITTTIPQDDTIPQSSEGSQIVSVNITPTTTTSRIVITATIPITGPVAGKVTLALFNGGVNAVAAVGTVTANTIGVVNIAFEFFPGSTTPLTLSARLGEDSGGTIYINGTSGGRLFGGISKAFIRAIEYAN